MTKTQKIMNEEEKQRIIGFISTGHFLRGLTIKENKNIKVKGKGLILESVSLFINDNENRKIYICSFEIPRIDDILRNHRSPGHIGINFKRTSVSHLCRIWYKLD
ncbi:hypothetical protein CDIK_4234 [Cucumispora dikerogammari]|nr:hypothetical protein CDIK_4234 [Cucumispora dikerogammari]